MLVAYIPLLRTSVGIEVPGGVNTLIPKAHTRHADICRLIFGVLLRSLGRNHGGLQHSLYPDTVVIEARLHPLKTLKQIERSVVTVIRANIFAGKSRRR